MYKQKRILGFIPARGGSKGLPRKNILPLYGKPLIVWTIEAAKMSNCLDALVVSTDDKEIADVAKEYGAQVPFMRPKEFAQDSSPTSDAIFHGLDFLKSQGQEYDYIALLEPTSPLRKKDDIDRAIQTLIDNPSVDTLVSLGEVHMEHPRIVKKMSEQGLVIPYVDLPPIYQRQQADLAYFPYGVIYISRVDVYRETKTFYTDKTLPHFIDRWQNYEIDDELDLHIIEFIMQKYQPLT